MAFQVNATRSSTVASADLAEARNLARSQRVLWNTVSNYLGKLVALGAGFFLTPFLIHALGAETYGLWVLVGSLAAYGALLDFGISSAITKYIAEYHARMETESAHGLIASALVMYSGLGLLVVILALGLAAIFPLIFHVPPDQEAQSRWLVVLSGVAVGIAIPATMTNAILRGLQRFDLINLLNSVGTLLSVALVVLVLLLGYGVLALVGVNILLTLGMQIPALALVHHAAPQLKLDWRAASRSRMRAVTSFSASLFIVNLAGQLQGKTDEIVIGLALPLARVTPYALAHRLSDVAGILTDQFLKVLLPLASELHAENDHARLRALYLTGSRLTLAGFVPFGCALGVLAAPLLTTWVGAEYAQYAPLVWILTLAGLIDMSQWAASHVLQGMARHRPLALIAIASGIANLVLSLILVSRLGLIGVAIGTLIPTALECGCLVMPYALRVIGVSWREAAREILLPGLVPAVPSLLVLFVLQQLLEPANWISLGILAAAGVVVYLAVYLIWGASAWEQRVYWHLIRQLFQRPARPAQG